jgi:hypothetical protein
MRKSPCNNETMEQIPKVINFTKKENKYLKVWKYQKI